MSRWRLIAALCIVASSATLLGVGAAISSGVLQTILVTLGCTLVLFLPLLALEGLLRGETLRAGRLATLALTTSQSAAGPDVSQRARELVLQHAVTDLGRDVANEEALAQYALELNAVALYRVLDAGATDLFSIKGVIAPIRSAVPARRRVGWYLAIQTGREYEVELKLYRASTEMARATASAQISAAAAISRLSRRALSNGVGAPPPVETLVDALATLAGALTGAWLGRREERARPVRGMRAAFGDGWVLDVAYLSSLHTGKAAHRIDLHGINAVRAVLNGIPWGVVRDAHELLTRTHLDV